MIPSNKAIITPAKSLIIFLTIYTLAAWVSLFSLFIIPADAKSAWLLGFSKTRWGMIMALFIIAAAVTAYAYHLFTHRNHIEFKVNQLKQFTSSKAARYGYYLAVFVFFVLLSVFLANWVHYQHDEYLNAVFLRAAPFVFLVFIAVLGSLFLMPIIHPPLLTDYGIFIVFIIIISLIDIFTNNLEVNYMPWDIKYYYLLAERGLSGERIAPYIYRYATPFLARQASDAYHVTIYQGYTIIAYLGAISQLFFLYLFLKNFGASARSAFLACLMIALCHYNVKYLLFDVSRPEHLAYFWVILTTWSALRSQWFWCGIFTLIGLQFREHVAIPPFIMILEQIKSWWYSRRFSGSLIGIGLVGICLIVAIIVPRLFIQVTDSTQFIDPQHPNTLLNLIYLPLDFKRDINFIFVIAAYVLPLLLLSTPERIKNAWEQLAPYHFFLILYSLITLILTLYGGHDLMRYITFLFLPQAFLLSRLFEQPISKIEMISAIIALIIFNRIFWVIPVENFDQNVDFYGGYDNRINIYSWLRWLEIFISISFLVGLRFLQKKHSHPLKA